MRGRRVQVMSIVCAALATGAALANGCAATNTSPFTSGSGGKGAGGAPSTSSATGSGGQVSTGSEGGGGTEIVLPDASSDAPDDVMINPCGSKCGPKDLCDADHLGLDDNCDGKQVDEGCSCAQGQVHFCFKGDPSYRGVPGCFDGVEKCNEMGQWGPCIGGVHASPPDNCFNNNTSSCHAITAAPFADVHLKSGTGMFSANAVPNSETWSVVCPAGVNPCPSVNGSNPPDKFKPLQSGEYTVTYTKVVAGLGMDSCSYPLFIGAPGLRVELTWEHTVQDDGVDLDLHVHEPNNTQPWGITPASPHDCTWSNCVFDNFKSPGGTTPKWFADPPAMPPSPVNWWLDPLMSNNTCFYSPRGVGVKWQNLGLGCHNPRLDLDDINCDFSIKDSNDPSFCAPENVNVDFPPNKQWIRVGVHYYSSHGFTYDVHPDVKIFCNGALAGELGSAGYYVPQTAVTFSPFDGDGISHRFWEVADVAFKHDQCSNLCIVKPLYSDANDKTPFFTNDAAAVNSFVPAYPPAP